jgi:hypothetical protein
VQIFKEFIYFQNAISLFLYKYIDRAQTTLNRTKIAAALTSKAIKAGFKFIFAHACEQGERDEFYREYCKLLIEDLNKGVDE